tara:strand:- start:69 stop:233 length:165 start_codon:yes stop_codon:yes gene_type:complete
MPVARLIKDLAEIATFKNRKFYKHHNGLMGYRFETPNVSYIHLLCNNLTKLSSN